MENANIPAERELPSTGKLVKSTIAAAATAAVLLVTVVMPAEYGIDPTGIGKLTGLKSMGDIKMSLAAEAEREKIAAAEGVTAAAPVVRAAEPAAAGQRSDEMQVTLAPNQGAEIKVALRKGEKVNFKWVSSGGKTNFDIHGDSKAAKIKYHGYRKGAKVSDEGVIEAAFDGEHGWFWRNRTAETLTVTLQTSGAYADIKRVE